MPSIAIDADMLWCADIPEKDNLKLENAVKNDKKKAAGGLKSKYNMCPACIVCIIFGLVSEFIPGKLLLTWLVALTKTFLPKPLELDKRVKSTHATKRPLLFWFNIQARYFMFFVEIKPRS